MTPRVRISLALAVAGLLLNAALLVLSVSAGPLAGCGGGGGCGEIFGSRWGQAAGVPVPVFGILAYGVLAWALARRKEAIAAFCTAAIAAAAVWFVVVQAALLHRFCPWCMAAHAVGIVLFFVAKPRHVLALASGFAAVVLLALLQAFGPAPVTHRITGEMAAAELAPVHVRGTGRKVAFDDGKKIYDTAALPRLGSADATYFLVEYFDYQCPACRKMGGYLAALVAKHPADIAVLLLPVPLDGACNDALAPADTAYPGSCRRAEIALAIWRSDPAAFPAVHAALLAGDEPAEASAAADPWIAEIVRADIADWVAFSRQTRKLPKLLIRDKRILHGLPSGEADFIRVMEKELGL